MVKILLSEVEKALNYIKKQSGDLYPVFRIQADHLEIAFTNIEGEATKILLYDESTQLPPKITTFARLK